MQLEASVYPSVEPKGIYEALELRDGVKDMGDSGFSNRVFLIETQSSS